MNVMHRVSRDAMKRAVRFMVVTVCVGLFCWSVVLLIDDVDLFCWSVFVAGRLFHSAVPEASCSALCLIECADLNE